MIQIKSFNCAVKHQGFDNQLQFFNHSMMLTYIYDQSSIQISIFSVLTETIKTKNQLINQHDLKINL